MTDNCTKCGGELNDETWYPSRRKKHDYTCKKCERERVRLWRKENPDRAKAAWIRRHRKEGMRPLNENRECPGFLGVHVAERVLRHAFKDVVEMPYGNPGYDFICNHGKKIDVKSSCIHKEGQWSFRIEHNDMADFFLCLAFDNREDLTPLHAWLIPGSAANHLVNASIRPSTVHKWDEYAMDLSKVSACCSVVKRAERAVSA